MKTLVKISTLGLLALSTNLYAHHPAEDMVDPDVYAMIEENISDVHLAMTFEDMGGNPADVGSAMEARDEDAGLAMGGEMEDVGSTMETREEMNAMADVEPTGPANSRR